MYFFRCIHEVTNAVYDHLAATKIKFPTTVREINESKQLFWEKFQFPGVLGIVDCTHVGILKPTEQEHTFVNRRSYHSLNVQLISDAELKIINVNSNFPGSCHDAFVWRQSTIRDHLLQQYNNGLRRTWLVGDSGYPLEPILMMPILSPPEDSPEHRFNNRLSSARNVIERCNGVLKMRLRCVAVERKARYAPHFMGKVVTVCATLHNMCMEDNMELPDFVPGQQEDVPRVVGINDLHNNHLFNEARVIRQNIINNYFNQ